MTSALNTQFSRQKYHGPSQRYVSLTTHGKAPTITGLNEVYTHTETYPLQDDDPVSSAHAGRIRDLRFE